MHVAALVWSLHALALSPPAVEPVVVAQADPSEDAFGDPPPPPPLSEEPELAPAPAPRLDPEPRHRAREERQRPAKQPDDGPVNAMLAAGVTAGTGVVLAVPAAAFCGVCSCFACPGPLACVPLGTAGGAAAGLLFAGADFSDVLVPATAAGAISLASGVLGIGTVLLVGIATGTAYDLANNVGVDPTFSSGAALFGMLINVGVLLGCMSLGAAGAGAAVYFLAPENEEQGLVTEATSPYDLPARRRLVASGMAY